MTRPTDCCSTDLPDATPTDRAGSASSEQNRTSSGTVARPLSCAQCGNDPDAIVRALKTGIELGKRQGAQDLAYETYRENIAAGELRADLEQQWHAHVRRYGE